MEKGGDVLIGHVTFLSVLGKTVYLQKQDLRVPVHLPVQVDRSRYPDALKISFRRFHTNGLSITSGSSSAAR